MMRNKLIIGISVFAVLTMLCGCASKDDSVKEVVFDTESAEGSEYDDSSSDEDSGVLVTSDEQSSFKVDAVAPAARESKKNYTGWISTSLKPITTVVGNVKLYANPKKGTFALFTVDENEKAIPVVSSSNEYTTTSFYLKAGNKVFKLCDDASVTSAIRKTDKGFRIRYSIERSAIVIIDFECFSSVAGEAEDSIKVTAGIISQAKKKQDFALKLIFDSILGETDRHHFYDENDLPVKGEHVYYTSDDFKWFTSKNSKANMQMIFAGPEASPVQSVILANYTTLDTKKWEPDMTTFRSFDTVLSYNNSAIGVFWPKTSIAPEDEKSFVFYISLAAGDSIPGGAAYLTAPAEEESEDTQAAAEPAAKEETPVQNIQAVKEETAAAKPAPEEQPVKEPAPVEAEPEPDPVKVVSTPETPAPAIDREKLSSDYIQSLIDRIEQLEEGDPENNKDEINALNAELDAIIAALNAN